MKSSGQQTAEALHQRLEDLLTAGRLKEAEGALRAVDTLLRSRSIDRSSRIWLLNVAARAEMELGRPTARRRLESALRLSRKVPDPTLSGVTLLNLGAEAFLVRDRRRAGRYWLRALHHFEKHRDYGRYAQALMNLVGLLVKARQLDAANEVLEGLLPMLKTARDPWGRFGVYLALGQLRATQGDHAAAATAFRTAIAAARRTGEESREASALQNLGSSYLDQGRVRRAISTYARALSMTPVDAASRFRATLMRSVALAQFRAGNEIAAELALRESRVIARSVGDAETLADATSDMGGLRITQRKWAAARHYLQDTLELRRALGDKEDVAQSLSNLAVLEEALHRYARAAELLVQAADTGRGEGSGPERLIAQAGDLWLSAGDVDRAVEAYKRSANELASAGPRATAWTNLISAAKLSDGPDPARALEFYTRAEAQYRALRETQLRFHTLNDRALCYARLGELGPAAQDLRRALAIGRRNHDRAMLARGYLNLGEVLRRKAELRGAIAALRSSVLAAKSLANREEEASALANLGLALLQADRAEEAERSFEGALALAETVRNRPLIAQASGGLGGVAMHRGDMAAAVMWYTAAIRIESALELQPQLAESTGAVCEAQAAIGRTTKKFLATFQRLVDMSQANNLEHLVTAAALRCARWFLHRQDLDAAGALIGTGLFMAVVDADDEDFEELGRASLEGAFYWLVHASRHADEFAWRVSETLDEADRGLGKALRPLLDAALEEAAKIPTVGARRHWSRRVASVQARASTYVSERRPPRQPRQSSHLRSS